jgi:uncharacterized OB-fold protein
VNGPRFDGRVPDNTFLPVPENTNGRTLPGITPESKSFWDGFGEGQLVLLRCGSCRQLVHYPVAGCVHCGGADLVPEAVDSAGALYSFTVCYLEFGAGMQAPYVVGHIELAVQPGLRLITNVVNCRIRDVYIGMPLEMVVVPGEQPLPFYQPAETTQRHRADNGGTS